MKKICTENQYDLYFNEENGYSIIDRENNIVYSLLEGKSLAGKATSDIIFIMKDAKYDMFGDLETSEEFVNYFCGATAFLNPTVLLHQVIWLINRKNQTSITLVFSLNLCKESLRCQADLCKETLRGM